jgi:hypothetical protein
VQQKIAQRIPQKVIENQDSFEDDDIVYAGQLPALGL